MNYKYILHSPKKSATHVSLKYNTAINLEQIPKFKYKSPRIYKMTSNSPTQMRSSKSRSPSIEQNWFKVKKIKKRSDPFENLNYGSPKIFQKLSPEQLIPPQLSVPSSGYKERRIVIKKKTEPQRIARSDTQYSITRKDVKNSSSSRIMIKQESRKEPSLNGWYVDPFDEYI